MIRVPKKLCPGCKTLKPLAAFYTEPRACRECKAKYYASKRDAILKQQKKYRTRKQLAAFNHKGAKR